MYKKGMEVSVWKMCQLRPWRLASWASQAGVQPVLSASNGDSSAAVKTLAHEGEHLQVPWLNHW